MAGSENNVVSVDDVIVSRECRGSSNQQKLEAALKLTRLARQHGREETADRELLVVDDGDGGAAADDGRRRLVGRQERAEASLLAPELALQLDVVGRVPVEVVAEHRREPGLRVAEAAEVGAVPFARLALDQMKGDPERSGSLFLSIALKK